MSGISAIRKSLVNNDKGFTLIEMAVVLIIIGLIVGAVVKGRDLVSSAKQKKLYNKFVQEWQMAYAAFYDRTGQVLGDFDGTDNGDSGDRDGLCSDASAANLVAQLERVGLDAPSEGATGSALERVYKDANGVNYTLVLTLTNDASYGNFIQITSDNGFPFDLGMAWDTIIDGTMDGADGDFMYRATASAAPTDWPDADTAAASDSVAILLLQL